MTSNTPRLASASRIAAAYLGNNAVTPADIPNLIRQIYDALSALSEEGASPKPEKQQPAVPIRRSITPDYIVSLEDGRHYKSLKRHLAVNGLTPMEYRFKWGLPPDYPMVAPNYAKQRSELARAIGLGRREPAVAPARKSRAERPKRSAG